MKKLKKIFILMLVITMVLTIGCTSNNEINTTDNDVSQNENEIENGTENGTENVDVIKAIEDLNLNYSAELDENGFFANLKALEYVKLFDYNNILIPSEEYIITEEIIQENLDELLSNFTTTSELTDRAVIDGDTVNIDYIGSVDGVEFEGGSTSGNGTDVTIGVTSYIDDFLEQLIGHNPGENFDIKVTFPEDYGVENLNGKDANFAISINYIAGTVTPELTDIFVSENLSDMSNVNTVEELKLVIQTDLKEIAVENYIQDYIIENTMIISVPIEIYQYQETIMKNYYEMSANSYDMTLEEFLPTYVGYNTIEEVIDASSEQLNFTSNFSLIIQAIAEDANIFVTEESLSAYFFKYTDSDDYSVFENIYGLPYLKNLILQENVFNYLIEHAKLEK